MSDLGFGAQNRSVPGVTNNGVTGADNDGFLDTTTGSEPTPPGDPDVIEVKGDSSTTEAQTYADPGMGDRGDPPPPQPPASDPADPSSATFANLPADQEGDGADPDDDETDDADVGEIHGEDGDSPEPEDAGAGPSDDTPVDTGDATFVNAESDPNPDVIPISGDSADDPNLGEPGDARPDLPPFDGGSGPVTYTPSSDPNAGLPPPPLPAGFVVRDGRVIREPPRPPLDGGLPPPPLPKGFVVRDGRVQRAETSGPDAAPSSRPGWLIPAAVAGLLVLGTVGFAATRGGGDAPLPAPTLAAPTAGVPTAAQTATVARTAAPTAAGTTARVTDTKVTEQGNVCLNQTILTVTAKIDGAKAGDAIVFALSGPGLPATVSGQLDASGGVTATMGTVGPVKGNQTWGAAVKSIAGKDVVSGPSQVFGFCPN